MVTPKERKLLTNLRGIKGRKIWVLCCRRSQSEEDMVLELFLHADRSMCLKFVCLAGGILEMRSLLLSSQLCISLLLLFPSWEAVFSLPQLSVTLQFPTLPFSLPLALFVHPWWKPFLLACVRAVPMLFQLVFLLLPSLLFLTFAGLPWSIFLLFLKVTQLTDHQIKQPVFTAYNTWQWWMLGSVQVDILGVSCKLSFALSYGVGGGCPGLSCFDCRHPFFILSVTLTFSLVSFPRTQFCCMLNNSATLSGCHSTRVSLLYLLSSSILRVF